MRAGVVVVVLNDSIELPWNLPRQPQYDAIGQQQKDRAAARHSAMALDIGIRFASQPSAPASMQRGPCRIGLHISLDTDACGRVDQ